MRNLPVVYLPLIVLLEFSLKRFKTLKFLISNNGGTAAPIVLTFVSTADIFQVAKIEKQF